MMLWEFLLLLPLLAGSSGLDCIEIPGSLKQIDVGIGQVFGVNSAGNIYTLHGNSWAQVPGSLKHVTVGPAGVWGVNNNNNIYKLVGGSWQQVTGLLKQIDAGGDMFVAGVNMHDDIYCLSRPATVSVNSNSALPWVNIAGKLKYYSCGMGGCWGVNSADDIYFRFDVTPDPCAGSRWEHVPGKLSMIEVGTEGSVYGVNSAGQVYRRDGITKSNPVGTTWTQVASFICNCKHVSYDLGLLWLITDQGKIVKCRI
ncbi:fish-egg lectin-like [Gopherus evgoodei]|uniref:fish-egg lectin-like n=1 Tax=Gopherus evgoodei TaxID=1825980 RepID=UPI0011CEF3BD|nr:fish-egg lectin-like [Gopherus evgoodei]